ncbi:FAD/NAD(P)-binding oxidoreductase [Sinomonas cyclohexanicum]|uniref:FAD/NAD(P)-binding oxidoreductase n=1 Tax=Sinomonas cyclohexanicum TaxID=322009 RepID=A0ABM7PTC2_SINCY|nr:FAD-dependent oxidoreductase [Corynebacterium cyclohexanicum]BCT75496.1 FAD/NAD(P)-binding oxidoreductase [Corynebacterium cyclohexanicum]
MTQHPIEPPTEHRTRIVVVGFGPVAARFVDELRPAAAAGAIELTVVGEEEHAAYNRVLVADLGVGRTSLPSMSLADADELAADRVRVLTSTRAARLDRSRRLVHLADGAAIPYDRVVLATGARAVVPTLTGLNPDPLHPVLPPGVTALRDVHDAARLASAVEGRRRVIVLGGGVLGLEAALAASEEGATVTVVHHGDRPLSRSIDRAGGATLTAALRRQGVRVAGNARSTGLETGPDGAFRALLLDDGSAIDGDLLVIACGARPRVELAQGGGLAVGSGVLVDHSLAALATEHVFAIGDCAEVGEAAPSGLIAPGWRQADWLAARFRNELLGEPAPEPLVDERVPVILLKARGVNLAVAGEVTAEPWDEFALESGCTAHDRPPLRVSVWSDPEHGAYVKMSTRGGVLAGFVALGVPRAAAELTLLFESGAELPSDRSLILRLDGAESAARGGSTGFGGASSGGPESTLCRCAGVSRGTVEEAVVGGCSTLEDVSAQTRAGTGCGGCRDQVRELIERHYAAA